MSTNFSLNDFTPGDFIDMGNLFLQNKAHDKAGALYEKALELEPESAGALGNLAVVAHQRGNLAEALDLVQRSLFINPRNPIALKARADVYRDMGKFEAADSDMWTAVALDPRNPILWNQMGYLEQVRGDLPKALSAYEQAVTLNPMDFESRLSVALTKMSMGVWTPETLQEYEIRHLVGGNPCPQNGKPIWEGQDITGKTILLCTEQGMGDAVMFARYARLLQDRGAKVIVLTRAIWEPLMWRFYGISSVCTHEDAAEGKLPEYDYHLPMMSCLRLLGVYDGDGPYMDLLDPAKFYTIPLVGYSWQGNPDHRNDRYRSVPRERFDFLKRLDVIPEPIHKGENGIENPIDLAKKINYCDLVITVDTATAHIAGALHKPVWLVLPVNADFRWAKGNDSTPWYPTMRIFRCREPLAWDEVFERVEKQFDEWRKDWR